MNKSTPEEYIANQLHTNDKRLTIAVTFLTGYNGIFIVTNSNIKLYLMKSITDENGFIQITIPPSAYESECLNNEIKSIIIDKGHYNENQYPFTRKPKFSTLGSIIQKSPQRPIISFMFEDSIRDLLGFNRTTISEK